MYKIHSNINIVTHETYLYDSATCTYFEMYENVEYTNGTIFVPTDNFFFSIRHPYTFSLMFSIFEIRHESSYTIPKTNRAK